MWNSRIVRELAVILLVKFTALYLIWLAFFQQPEGQVITHHEVGQFILSESRDSLTPPSLSKEDIGDRNGN